MLIEDKSACVQELTKKLECMPQETLAYIKGAIDMAALLDINPTDDSRYDAGQAS